MAATACCVAMGTGSKWETGTDDSALFTAAPLSHQSAVDTSSIQAQHHTRCWQEYEEYFIYSPAGSFGITLSDKQKGEIKKGCGCGGDTGGCILT